MPDETIKMSVSLDGLRSSAVYAFNDLTKTLNNNIDKYGEISIEANDIQQAMDDLRSAIAGLCCVYMKNVEDFNMIYDEIAPIEEFNPKTE